ncbi:hypothetical protein AAIG11_11515, partial [Anoxynatronum sibiricum]
SFSYVNVHREKLSYGQFINEVILVTLVIAFLTAKSCISLLPKTGLPAPSVSSEVLKGRPLRVS